MKAPEILGTIRPVKSTRMGLSGKIFWAVVIALTIGILVYRDAVGSMIWRIIGPVPCAKPIAFDIGTFDDRFGISRQEFVTTIEEAAKVWQIPIGKKLFVHETGGSLKINLIYDYRQKATDKLSVIDTDIHAGTATYQEVKAKYIALTASLDVERSVLASLKSSYTEHLKKYEDEISYWNGHGGAPREQYAQLQEEKDSLTGEVVAVNAQVAKANAVADSLNSTAATLNSLAKSLNGKVETANDISSSAGEQFDEGIYVQNASGRHIDIYQYDSEEKLKRVLAHELGHALGLEHVDDPKAIMYWLNESSNNEPTTEDVAELKKVCRME